MSGSEWMSGSRALLAGSPRVSRALLAGSPRVRIERTFFSPIVGGYAAVLWPPVHESQ
jgi:hypothetical protein